MVPPLPETFVDTPEQLAECCAHLAGEDLIGFDTEFIGEHTYNPVLCLIQISTESRLFVVDPLALEDIAQLWTILIDPAKTVIVHSGREEARMARAATGEMPLHFFDLQIALGLVGLHYPISYAGMVRDTLRVKLHKSETLTDWSKRPLSERQLIYAYDDVRYLIPIYKKTDRKLKKLQRHEWLKDEWGRYCQKAVRDNAETERWRKIKGIGNLDRRQLAVAREIYLWREGRAEALNRPSRYLLRDDLILEIAKRVPRTARDLESLRGITQRDIENIFAACERGTALPEEKLPKHAPREPDVDKFAWVVQMFGAVLASRCRAHQLHPSLVATTADLKWLVKSFHAKRAAATASGLLSGWRRELFYETFRDLWDGRQGMRLKRDKKGLAIECFRHAEGTAPPAPAGEGQP